MASDLPNWQEREEICRRRCNKQFQIMGPFCEIRFEPLYDSPHTVRMIIIDGKDGSQKSVLLDAPQFESLGSAPQNVSAEWRSREHYAFEILAGFPVADPIENSHYPDPSEEEVPF